jgi:curved DNA-binding protein CbpA
MEVQNPFKVLGIPHTATNDEIESAYRKLAKVHHPDRQGGSVEQMQAINKARDQLNDPHLRSRFGHEMMAADRPPPNIDFGQLNNRVNDLMKRAADGNTVNMKIAIAITRIQEIGGSRKVIVEHHQIGAG